jgi:hypothetical protein
VNQISATFIKGLKDNFMNKPALFWVIAWPAIWLLLAVFVFLRQIPPEFAALAKGQSTISMVTFSIMICGMTSLPANIAEDRQRGLFQKLKTMPVQPTLERINRQNSGSIDIWTGKRSNNNNCRCASWWQV